MRIMEIYWFYVSLYTFAIISIDYTGYSNSLCLLGIGYEPIWVFKITTNIL